MANVRLVFSGTTRSETECTTLECFLNTNNEIFITIKELQSGSSEFICLDRVTAIKLHKELKKQISFFDAETV